MKCTRIFFIALTVLLLGLPALADTQDNSTPGIAKPVQEQTAAPALEVAPTGGSTGKFPLDIQGRGTDQSGTLLSYKLKEEVIASKLFDLKVSEKKKFVLHVITQAEFPDRPSIASQYSIVLVYQEDAGTLTYYLNHYQGQVHTEGVAAEMQKILEWAYSNLKRYHYLLEE
jgi:ABC-type transport system substrate-binding protein